VEAGKENHSATSPVWLLPMEAPWGHPSSVLAYSLFASF
jgi:hypothetical protein